MNQEFNYKNHLDKKLAKLPIFAEERAIRDRLDVSPKVAEDLHSFYLKTASRQMENLTLKEYLEKIEQDVESGRISPEGVSKSGLANNS